MKVIYNNYKFKNNAIARLFTKGFDGRISTPFLGNEIISAFHYDTFFMVPWDSVSAGKIVGGNKDFVLYTCNGYDCIMALYLREPKSAISKQKQKFTSREFTNFCPIPLNCLVLLPKYDSAIDIEEIHSLSYSNSLAFVKSKK